MIQYPHIFKVETLSEATKDANGNWIAGAAVTSPAYYCREEGNGSGRKIQVTDGEAYLYSSLIYCPLDTTLPKPGTRITVYESDEITVRISGSVRSIYKGQLNSRIWL